MKAKESDGLWSVRPTFSFEWAIRSHTGFASPYPSSVAIIVQRSMACLGAIVSLFEDGCLGLVCPSICGGFGPCDNSGNYF